MWGPWGTGLEGRHLLGQTLPGRVTPWILAVSALESGPNGETGYGATRETPAGASGGALPRVAGGRAGGHSRISQNTGAVSCHHGSPQSTSPRVRSPGLAVRSPKPRQESPRIISGVWLILEPFWASVSASVKDGRQPSAAPTPQPTASTELSEGSGWLRGGSGLCKLRVPGLVGGSAGG